MHHIPRIVVIINLVLSRKDVATTVLIGRLVYIDVNRSPIAIVTNESSNNVAGVLLSFSPFSLTWENVQLAADGIDRTPVTILVKSADESLRFQDPVKAAHKAIDRSLKIGIGRQI